MKDDLNRTATQIRVTDGNANKVQSSVRYVVVRIDGIGSIQDKGKLNGLLTRAGFAAQKVWNPFSSWLLTEAHRNGCK